MRVLSLNILGPNFSNPEYYPEDTHPYLNADYRWAQLRAFLITHKGHHDVIVLQEVTHDTRRGTFDKISEVLSEFTAFFVPHAYDHWAEDEFSYGWIPNGNAIFVRHNSTQNLQCYDIDLTCGNHAALVTFVYHGVSVCLVNLHLDSDNTAIRVQELRTALKICEEFPAHIHLCVGDFNTALNIPPYQDWIQSYQYESDTNTIPTFTIIETPIDELPIDHIIHRSTIPIHGTFTVLNAGIWKPSSTNSSRFIQNSRYCGSDHLPIAINLQL